MFLRFLASLSACGWLLSSTNAALVAQETNSTINIRNDRLAFELTKSSGKILSLSLDNQQLLGAGAPGFYFDCYCTPSGFYTPGADNVTLITGPNNAYAGIVVSHTYKNTGQFFQKYWFLKDRETNVHTWTRLAYYNESVPFLRNLQELRTMFRPKSGLFTHLATDQSRWGPLPSAQAVANQVVVQDATWYLGNTPNDPYVTDVSPYFTKYTFSVPWRKHKAHGMYADGSTTNGTSFGAWLVMDTTDTYFGGPLHSDLVVDGIVYDYISSNHHGDGTPNITYGFDRTFGPVSYLFNSNNTINNLLAEAEAQKPDWEFYDEVAKYVHGYVPSSLRGAVEVDVQIPKGATNAVAVLSASGRDFQDNVEDVKAYQYWAEVGKNGKVTIGKVKDGQYRLTVYADGIFGNYIQDNIRVVSGKSTKVKVNWKPRSAGKEIWRIGTPDKSSGEFLHGNTPLPAPRHFPEYTIFWGAYDWATDFPNGVNFTVGQSDEKKDLNYVHWSGFQRPTENETSGVLDTTANWTINFDLKKPQLKGAKKATFTVQLAGVKTASGNTDVPNGDYSDLELAYIFNGHRLSFVVPYYHSSSCVVRSEVSCYQVEHIFEFDAAWLKEGWNQLILSLPYNATDTETAILPGTVYVQYDALRLELQ